MNVIEMNRLTKHYGKSRGIADINLTVEEGEIFGFIGPNGAGKSTAIRTLLGLMRPTGGSATIFGQSCLEHPDIRRELGYLPSEVFYYDHMRVRELLNYSAGFYKKDCARRIRELADIMDLDLNKKIDDLSFGNKKKVGIVQGLLHEPKLIILDEPTSGLDPLMQQRFFDLLAEENRKGATVFFSSHILSEVQKMCSRVAFIKEGELIKLEKMSDLQADSYKRFTLEAASAIRAEDLQIEGVSKLENGQGANSVTFMFKGDINDMLRRISGIELRNISIEEPDLEEIFLHYYAKEDRAG
ncbi:ABC transporter ATP-binding protein [Saccharibacillus sp. CPCC 101409]|uniref:ABC transporter ATP-binding protein n=1 Tax=Saccharibacillus sp. CPCC 101409 TaxID=3058041 RepID=UPI0026730486|nr:ABC transporter ATP-binding protein [Saccharibacillus sp. CPCC 101409]MDO3411136.1 ABC transporter ATP-binding protein [Saccharibacillus sp. CPCC 101409]